MKVYFEDGPLVNLKKLPIAPDYIIDVADGVSKNIEILTELYVNNRNCIIYTNSILAFSNRYAWNDKLKVPEIFICNNEYGIFTNICELTNRELREGLNLANLYIGGEFR